MEIRHTKWGLANNYGDYIEINEDLKDYPKLYNYILAHELGHVQKFDLHHEFKFKFVPLIKLFFFCLSHPRTLVDLMPIQYKNKEWYFDLNLTVLYAIISCLVFFLYAILK